MFTLTVAPGHEDAAKAFVMHMSPNARLTYELGGTVKYELPTADVSLARVFDAMATAKTQMQASRSVGVAGGVSRWRGAALACHLAGRTACVPFCLPSAYSPVMRPAHLLACPPACLNRVTHTRTRSQVLDWGVANATLEEVFIKFAREIGAETEG